MLILGIEGLTTRLTVLFKAEVESSYLVRLIVLKGKQINVKKILAVINATYAIAKRKPEKIRPAGIRTPAFFSQLPKLR